MRIENSHLPLARTLRQLSSYALIGVLTNTIGYVLYLFLTYFWDSPKMTMTILYSIGALAGFIANRRLTFGHDGHIGATGFRYLLVQFFGYLLNLCLLLLFADWLGFSHRLVQAISIFIVAIFLFILLRTFVFAPHLARSGTLRP